MNDTGYRDAHKKWLRYCTVEGAFANVFINFTGGAFITGLALLLGANDFQIGLLASIPFLSQLFQLTSTSVSNRLGGRRKAAIILSAVGRQIWWIVPIIVLTTFGWKLEALLIIVFISNACIMAIRRLSRTA